MLEKPGNSLETNTKPVVRRNIPTELEDLLSRRCRIILKESLPLLVERVTCSLVGRGFPPPAVAWIVDIDPCLLEIRLELLREQVVRFRSLRDAARRPTQVRAEVARREW